MLTLLKNLWRLVNYPRLKLQERKKQQAGGFEIEIPSGSRGEYVVYREGNKWLDAQIDISWRDGVRLYTQSLKKWQAPMKGQQLSQAEYELVVKRISEYLSIEGEVTLDNSPLMSYEEQLASMREMAEGEGWEMVSDTGEVKFARKSPKDAREA
jgi:hypothetical protein